MQVRPRCLPHRTHSQPFQVSHPLVNFRRRHHPAFRSHGFRPENIFQMETEKSTSFSLFSITVLLLPDLAFLLLVPSGDGASRQPYARRRIPLPPASLSLTDRHTVSCTACRTDIRPAGLKIRRSSRNCREFLLIFQIQTRYGTDQRPGIRVTWTIENILTRSALHDDAGIHNGNLLCDTCHNTESHV